MYRNYDWQKAKDNVNKSQSEALRETVVSYYLATWYTNYKLKNISLVDFDWINEFKYKKKGFYIYIYIYINNT